MPITFVPLYPNVVALDKVIDNLITLLSDELYQAEALRWANEGEDLEPYALISESAAWRESEAIPTPILLIKRVTAEEDDDEGPLLRRTLRFSVYQVLSNEGDHEMLKRESYRRNLAVAMMIRSAQKSGFDLFEGTGISPGGVLVQVPRCDYGDTEPGRASYYRSPSVDVEIPIRETQ